MGRSCLPVLLMAVLIMLSISHGFGRKMMGNFGNVDNALAVPEEISREMMELDYVDPGPNVNAKSGIIFAPPPSQPPPPLPLPPLPPAAAEEEH